MTPRPTPRLRFREMKPADLDDMARLLGDPEVMRFYPRPKTPPEALAWIDWNRRNYREHGHGLWIIEDTEGRFVGDCGLSWQHVNGLPRLEVGYHVLPASQGHGLATEAASGCRDFARDVLKAPELVAIIHPENTASRRVAEKIGMVHREDDRPGTGDVRTVMAMDLGPAPSPRFTP